MELCFLVNLEIHKKIDMSRFFYVTYSERKIPLFEPDRPGFRLTSPASRSKIANLKYGREGGSGSNLRLKHTFKRGNFAVTKFENMLFVIDHCSVGEE